jgi:hypothetical protein
MNSTQHPYAPMRKIRGLGKNLSAAFNLLMVPIRESEIVHLERRPWQQETRE